MKRFLIALAFAGAFVITAGISDPAVAGYTVTGVKVFNYDDGTVGVMTLVTNDKTGQQGVLWTLIYADGHYDQGKIVLKGNPNPEGDDTDSVDVKELAKHLKQKGGPLKMITAFEKTKVGKHLTGKGKGLGPVSQPGVGGDSGPSTGANPDDLFGNKDLFPENNGGGKVGGIPFEPNSGGPKEFVHKNKGKKGKKDESSHADKKTGIGQGAFFGNLPGPPELVNPNPVARSRTPTANQPAAATMQLPSAGGGHASAPSSTGITGPLR